MYHILGLLLPALIPSWRFFDKITISPRIEFSFFNTNGESSDRWHEFRPRPSYFSIASMLKSLIWNARWNEYLFLISCAERLIENHTEKGSLEIIQSIKAELERSSIDIKDMPYLQFRLFYFHNDGKHLQKQIVYKSKIYQYFENNNL